MMEFVFVSRRRVFLLNVDDLKEEKPILQVDGFPVNNGAIHFGAIASIMIATARRLGYSPDNKGNKE